MPKHKYKKTGTFLGNKTMSIVFKQVISVENSYPRSMKLLVIDQLPVSTEDKLKVSSFIIQLFIFTLIHIFTVASMRIN